MSTDCVTPEFRVSFPAVFQAKLNKLNNKQEFSLVALFKKGENMEGLKKAAMNAAIKKWGEDRAKWPTKIVDGKTVSAIRLPFRDQSEKSKDGKLPEGHEMGAVFMTLRSEQRPKVVDQSVQEIIEPHKFYAGCWARASVNAFAYDQMGNKGVSFGLNHLQLVRDGDPFSARPRVEDAFKPIDMPEGASTSSANDLFS